MSVIIKLLSKFDDSGIKKAKSGFGGLTKTLGAVGIGFGVKAIADGLLDAAKAAAADEKSTRLLNIQLVRNAGATANQLKQNDRFIESLSLQTGIMDDDLRPAMARFGNVTGNVEDAQRLLRITLDGSAGSGKGVEAVSKAVSKAYAGNTTSLKKLFPELTKSKDVLGDFAKTYKGLAEENADPFMKFNNSMDILKEKLGAVVLPILIDFIDEISKEGGAIEVVGKFFDDLANPKSDAGKTFDDIKDAIGGVIDSVKTFFGFFGNGDAIEGFKNVATGLINALPALLALKGIMVLANAGKTVANLVAAMTAISAKSAVPTGDGGPFGWFGKLGPKMAKFLKFAGPIATVATVLSLSGDTKQETPEEKEKRLAKSEIDKANLKKNAGKIPGLISTGIPGTTNRTDIFSPKPTTQNNVTNNITINVPNADPKAIVNTLSKYTKTNGAIPPYLLAPKG